MPKEQLSEPTPGTLIASYRMLRLVGEGGMAVVWEAEHVGLKKRVAVKMLGSRLLKNANIVHAPAELDRPFRRNWTAHSG